MKQQNNQIEWKEVELRELGDICAGGTPSRTKPEYWGGNIPWLKISNLKEFYVTKYDETITEKGLNNSSAKIFKKGTILISIFASLGDVAILDIDATTNQAIAGIYNLREYVNPEYLALYLKSLKEYFEKIGRGVAQSNLNLSILRSTKIFLPFSNAKPDIKEQERIVNLLEKAEKLKESGKKAEELLNEYLNSIFNETFLKENFKIDRLKEHTLLISSGSTPLGGSKNYLDKGEILFIRSQNVLMNKFSNHDKIFISKEMHEKMKRTWIKKNDVLLNITGASIGRTAIYCGEDNKANVNQHVCIIRLNKELNPYFVNYYFSSKRIQDYINKINAGGTREALNFKQIGDIKIPLPPIFLQQKFSKIVEQVEKMKANLKKVNSNAEELFKSLMQKAFNGEL